MNTEGQTETLPAEIRKRGPGRPPKDRAAIAPVQRMEVAWDDEKKGLLKQLMIASSKGGPIPTDAELALAVHICTRTGLDPFVRQIYFIKYGGKMTPQVSIDGFRLNAQRTGDCAGTDPIEYGMEQAGTAAPEWARCTVYRIVKGMRVPFTAIARWKEYVPQNPEMWRRMPYLMIGKCAEALALRMAFPAELSGLYTDDEMAQADRGDTQVIEVAAKVSAPQAPAAPAAKPPPAAAPQTPKPQAPTPLPPPQQPPAQSKPQPTVPGGISPETQKEFGTLLAQKCATNDVAKLRKALKDLTGVDRSIMLTEEAARNHIESLKTFGIQLGTEGNWIWAVPPTEAPAEEGV